jgi:putative flavoprotein involved in K+ transport
MPTTDTIIIGGGQAGLATSHWLSTHGHDHVVLERGGVGERWRSEVWDSLRLLTPNWMNTLPGWSCRPDDSDAFLAATEFADHLADYAASFSAPVRDRCRVDAVRHVGSDFEVLTQADTWRARRVVLATGWCDEPAIPGLAADLHGDVHQLAPSEYRNPGSIPAGGVLVVGASATGVQLAEELRAAGRDVTLAVGRHSRLPRRYRGMDIFWWLDRLGTLDRTLDDLPDAHAARTEPSLQLVGRPDHRSLDLASLQASGVRLAGRLAGVDGTKAWFAPDLGSTVRAADLRMLRVLDSIDDYIVDHGLESELLEPERIPIVRPHDAIERMDLRALGVSTVIWATGHRRPYSWLQVPVLDRHGEIRQRRGITPVPGLYVVGQRFQHWRRSNFIGGVGRDAGLVARHIVSSARRLRPDAAFSAH